MRVIAKDQKPSWRTTTSAAMPAEVAGFIVTPSAVNPAWIASPSTSQKSQSPAARGRDPRRTFFAAR